MAAAYGLLDRLQIEVRGRDEGYVVAEVESYVQLVGREEYALVLSVRQLGQKRAQFVAVGHVEEGRGLVEQDHGRLLRQRTRYHDTLALAVRHAVHRAVGVVGHADRRERLLDNLGIALLHAPDPVGIGGASERHDITAPQVGNTHSLRRYRSYGKGHACGCVLLHVAAVDCDASRHDGLHA